MTVKPGWEIPMNRQYLEYIPEIGTPAANSHHGPQHQLHEQPGCKAANPSNHHKAEACSPWADHVGDSATFLDQVHLGLGARNSCHGCCHREVVWHPWIVGSVHRHIGSILTDPNAHVELLQGMLRSGDCWPFGAAPADWFVPPGQRSKAVAPHSPREQPPLPHWPRLLADDEPF